MSFVLTKTNYKTGVRCKKYLWLKKNRPDLAKAPNESEQLNIEEGILIGQMARSHPRFAGGLLVEHPNKEITLSMTKRALAEEKHKHFYEAAFLYDEGSPCYVEVDILEKNEDGSFNLIEVKSASRNTKEHLTDVAFQKWVLKKMGFRIKDVFLMKVNKSYVHQEEEINLQEYFVIEEVSALITDIYKKITKKVETLQKVIDSEKEPTKQIGAFCKNPYNCPFKDYCHSHVNADSVEKLSRLSKGKRKQLRGLKVKVMRDIPITFDLTPRQAIQRKVAVTSTPHYNLDKLKDYTAKLVYPLYYLDFECYNRSIPPYKGASPNKFNTFQASLHIQQKDGSIEHREFLFEEKSSPHRSIAQWLVDNLGDSGSVVVYNESFEKSRMQEISLELPEFKQGLDAICNRLWDLESPFKNNWYYIHDFEGSSSIKYILPALVPELNYSNLIISNGEIAQAIYWNFINHKYHEKTDNGYVKGEEYHRMRQALLDYCKLDTFAMVKVLEKVVEIIEDLDKKTSIVAVA